MPKVKSSLTGRKKLSGGEKEFCWRVPDLVCQSTQNLMQGTQSLRGKRESEIRDRGLRSKDMRKIPLLESGALRNAGLAH